MSGGPCAMSSHDWGPGSPCTVISRVEGAAGPGEGSLYGRAQCIMHNGYMGPHPCCEQTYTYTTESITFQQLSWQVVIYLFEK